MKISGYILGGMAALALLLAVPVYAEMTDMADSDLDGIAAKGTADATVDFDSYVWDDDHAEASSAYKGALENAVAITMGGVNTANVWGAYAGAEAFGPLDGGDTTSTAVANGGIGGF